MSEEEIINIIEKVLSNKEIGLLETTDTFYQAIQGLLDLYQKEKEKNKELQYQLEIEKIDNKYNQEENNEETIPKYKIINKIEEIKEEIKEDLEKYKKIEDESWKKAIHQSINIKNRIIEVLQELLLEERN